MDPKQTKIVLGITLLMVLLWLAFPLLGKREEPAGAKEEPRLGFEAARALQATQEFVTSYPRRVLGSIEARQSTGYLQQRFQELGYKVTYSHFDATIAGRKQVGRNVYAFRPSPSPEILVVIAHYDTARTTFQGAMDDGSGIGVLLELARVIAGTPARRSLLFVASDGEEWGMLGALDLARNHPDRDRFVAALSLDYVTAGALAQFTFDTVGQISGYTPPWLRALARAAGEAEGLPASEPAGFQEFLERAFLLSWTDQGPLLNAGIPAINLGSEARDRTSELAIYHSAHDTVENLRVDSYGRYGRVAERILRTLDGLRSVPRESMGAFRVQSNIMLAPSVMAILQYLAFLPLFATLCFHLGNHRQYFSTGRIQREVSSFLGTIFPFLIVYCAVLLLSLLRHLPHYTLYPATPKDPILEHPQRGALGGILTAGILAAIGCYFLIRFLNRKLPRPDFYVSKSILLVILCAVAVAALLYNPYWAVSFLILPAWLWGLIGHGQGAGGRAANRMLILAAGVLYYMVSCSYASRLCLGWKLLWYEILALSTGMFHWQAFTLSAVIFALAVRFLAIQSFSRSD